MYTVRGTKAQSLSPRNLYFNERKTYFNSADIYWACSRNNGDNGCHRMSKQDGKEKSSTKLAP